MSRAAVLLAMPRLLSSKPNVVLNFFQAEREEETALWILLFLSVASRVGG